MSTVTSAILGVVFLGLGFAVTFLMYYLWGFPFDKTTRKSAAPKWLMFVHRAMGYAYAGLYVIMMVHMVPRMWQYQVELPPRTVAHLMLGMLIGIILVVKIGILRFFRHLEEWMPYLGTALMVCTVLLLGLSLPFVFRERALASQALGGSAFSLQNRQRVATLVPMAHFPAGTPLTELSTEASLRAGQSVLLEKCVRCHDLKTVLERPRTPSDWVATVSRMAEKPAVFTPISEPEQWRVAAYLIAITPDLQKSEKRKEETEDRAQPGGTEPIQMGRLNESKGSKPPSAKVKPSAQKGHELFTKTCAPCHGANAQGGEGPNLHGLELTDAGITRTIKEGIKGKMPGFAAKFKEAEIKDLIAYLRSLKK